jgi:hypothetical protein
MRDSSNFFLDSLKFSWKGGPVLIADLGDPTETTRNELCIYDAGGFRFALGVPPGSHWSLVGSQSAPRGYRYKDLSAAEAGVRDILLKGSSIGKASLKLNGRGPYLPDTTLPFALPVRAQLYASDGSCWDTRFGVAETKHNDTGSFSAKAR